MVSTFLNGMVGAALSLCVSMPSGYNVLYMDTHVEFIKYPGKFAVVSASVTSNKCVGDPARSRDGNAAGCVAGLGCGGWVDTSGVVAADISLAGAVCGGCFLLEVSRVFAYDCGQLACFDADVAGDRVN